MKYSFDIALSDKDYFEFNKFHLKHSSYGKKYHRTLLCILIAVAALFSLYVLVRDKFALTSVLLLLPYAAIAAIMALCYIPIEIAFLKISIKNSAVRGKALYSKCSTLELYEDYFCEITEQTKNENRYSAIERVYIYGEKYVYIYTNSVMAYIIPRTIFESSEQYSAFCEFIKEKSENVFTVKEK